MKKYIHNILFVGIALLMFSQLKAQEPSYIFYNQHKNLVNPAAVGTEKGHTISVDIRNQWQGVVDAPQTQTFFTTHKINERIGLGFSIANNKVFIQKQAGIYADFSYSLQKSSFSALADFSSGAFQISFNRAATFSLSFCPTYASIFRMK